MNDALFNKLMADPHRFKVLYGRAFVTGFNEDNVVDVIKKFNSCYNSTITMICDSETGMSFISKENDEPDCRGYYNHHFINNKTGEIVYNEDEATRPLDKIKSERFTIKSNDGYIDPNGKYYSCGYQEHRYLSKELCITNTLKISDDDKKSELYQLEDYEKFLDGKGWVKISASRISHHKSLVNRRGDLELTDKQKKAIINYVMVVPREMFEFQYHSMNKQDIIEELSK